MEVEKHRYARFFACFTDLPYFLLAIGTRGDSLLELRISVESYPVKSASRNELTFQDVQLLPGVLNQSTCKRSRRGRASPYTAVIDGNF